MDRCVYAKVCPCFVGNREGLGVGCAHLPLPCKLAVVYQHQEKFAWPPEKCYGTPTEES